MLASGNSLVVVYSQSNTMKARLLNGDPSFVAVRRLDSGTIMTGSVP